MAFKIPFIICFFGVPMFNTILYTLLEYNMEYISGHYQILLGSYASCRNIPNTSQL